MNTPTKQKLISFFYCGILLDSRLLQMFNCKWKQNQNQIMRTYLMSLCSKFLISLFQYLSSQFVVFDNPILFTQASCIPIILTENVNSVCLSCYSVWVKIELLSSDGQNTCLCSRCCQIFKTVRLIRGVHKVSPDDKERYRLYIAQLQDYSTLGVLEAFMEDAPQVNIHFSFPFLIKFHDTWHGFFCFFPFFLCVMFKNRDGGTFLTAMVIGEQAS